MTDLLARPNVDSRRLTFFLTALLTLAQSFDARLAIFSPGVGNARWMAVMQRAPYDA